MIARTSTGSQARRSNSGGGVLVALKHVTNPADDVLGFDDRSRIYSRSGPKNTVLRDATGDSLSDTLETLYSEHRYLASLVDSLEKESARLKPGKIPDYHLLLDIIDYLTHYPQVYHHPREDLLFGTLLERDAEFPPLLERLEREHHTLEVYNHELLEELTGIVAGQAVDRPSLLRRIERYIAAYRQHMDYESGEIFPRARGRLSAADLKTLAAKTRHIDDPLFGGEIQYRYRRLGRNLEARAEMASQEILSREFSAIQSTIGRLSGVVNTLGELKNVIEKRRRQSWREQKETIRDHLRPGRGPSVLVLSRALMRCQVRQWREGVGEIRKILRDGPGDGADGP